MDNALFITFPCFSVNCLANEENHTQRLFISQALTKRALLVWCSQYRVQESRDQSSAVLLQRGCAVTPESVAKYLVTKLHILLSCQGNSWYFRGEVDLGYWVKILDPSIILLKQALCSSQRPTHPSTWTRWRAGQNWKTRLTLGTCAGQLCYTGPWTFSFIFCMVVLPKRGCMQRRLPEEQLKLS